MANGNAWTRAEIDLLVKATEAGDPVEELAERLQRTPDAVKSKASKLRLKIFERR